MSKYAVIQHSGKQFRVAEGDEVELDKINLDEGKKIDFKDVLLFVDGEKVSIGQPVLSSVVVEGKVISHYKGPKIRVATYKAKSRHRKVKGFRPQHTRIKIEKITIESPSKKNK